MAKKKTLPYWLGGGTDLCDLCQHPHVLQALRRCAGCDRASCEHCVVIDRDTGEVLCHACAADGEEG